MAKRTRKTIEVRGTPITVLSREGEDFISLSDMVRPFEGGEALIERWLGNTDTILFLGVREQLNDPAFNAVAFEGIRDDAGRSSFYLPVWRWGRGAWSRPPGATRGRSRTGTAPSSSGPSQPGVQALPDHPFQRLQAEEGRRRSEAWDLTRTLSRLNYRMLSATIKEKLVPPSVTPEQAADVYRSEADLLNVPLFGQTAEAWREANPGLAGTMRDYASIEQLLVLVGLENLNAEMIRMDQPQEERLRRLNEIAIRQLSALAGSDVPRRIGPGEACAA